MTDKNQNNAQGTITMKMLKKSKTISYGIKKNGLSKFVIIAPHAAGDDKNTEKIAIKLAQHLNASLVVNNRFKKSIQDFNKIPSNSSNTISGLVKKRFYKDIQIFTESARQYSEDGRAIVIYVHGIKDGKSIGIDLGIGAKYDLDNKLKGTSEHSAASNNTGEIRMNKEKAKKLQKLLNLKLKPKKLVCTIGKKYAAWGRTTGIQFHYGTVDESIQFEIAFSLRRPKNIEFISKVIAGSLKSVYGID